MTTFNDKEKAAENKYARDKETEFKVHARAHKLLGLWAAGKMGLSGPEAQEYAKSLVEADLGKISPQSLTQKVGHDLLAKDVHISDHDIRLELHRFEQQAREQLL